MNEERSQILRMLQEGKITVEEAAQLIDALSSQVAAPKAPALDDEPSPTSAGGPTNQPALWALQNVLGCDIGNAVFDGAKLEGARLWFCNLDGANLRNADLTNAWIVADNLNNANLADAKLAGVRMIGCNLDHANFAGADLSGALIIGANFDHGDFHGADLRNRVLIGVNLARQRSTTAATPVPIEE